MIIQKLVHLKKAYRISINKALLQMIPTILIKPAFLGCSFFESLIQLTQIMKLYLNNFSTLFIQKIITQTHSAPFATCKTIKCRILKQSQLG